MRTPKRSTLAAIAFAGVVLSAVLARTSRPRILVLHSFREDATWVRGVDEGLRAGLAANRRPVTVGWHFMGLDREASGDRTRLAVADAKREIALFAPDLIVAVDDESNALVAREHAGHDRPRVVYVSIDRPPASYGYVGAANATGVAERLPLDGVRDAIGAARAGRPARIGVIASDGETGRAELAQARAFDWEPHRLERADAVATWADWQAWTERAIEGVDAVVVLSSSGLRRGAGTTGVDGSVASEAVPAAEVVAWTERHCGPLPVGTGPNWVEHGGALAVAPPAEAVGRQAIEMALDWLDDRAGPGPPPPTETSHFDVALDEGRLLARGIVMPRIWVEAARVRAAAPPG